MDDDEQYLAINETDCAPALLAFVDAVLVEEGERIREDGDSIFEGDSMLGEVRAGLERIPFEVCLHYANVTTELSFASRLRGGSGR